MSSVFFTEEENKFRDELREFVKNEIEPMVTGIEKKNGYELIKKSFRKLGAQGFLGVLHPKDVGGSAKGLAYEIIVGDEIAYASGSLDLCRLASVCLYGMPLNRFGTKEQRHKYLAPVIKGEKIGAIGITEPDVGSDTAGMKTNARKEGDHYVLNGEKRFITNGSQADFLCIFAITNPKVHPHQGMSAFIIEKGMPGFTALKDYELMGLDGAKVSHLKFENVNVPKENLLGAESFGFPILMDELDSERTAIAGQLIGGARAALDIAVKYSTERVQFDQTISRFEAVSFKVADMATRIEATRLLALEAARRLDKGLPATKHATMAKLFASETAIDVTYQALQVLGGIGYTKEYPIEMLARTARLATIGGGTAEICRFLIQREVYKEFKGSKKK
ncbi:MAG: acyl-CoA dehydrogenase family protein [Candidatus Atabeyarchaeum deiterrae]